MLSAWKQVSLNRSVRGLAAAAFLVSAVLGAAGSSRAAQHGLTPQDLWRMVRLSEPRPSPDGGQIVLVARSFNVEKNSSRSHLWLVDAGGGAPRRLTSAASHDHSPRWLPDGKAILFLSDRSGSSQIWAVDPAGGEPQQASSLPLDVGNLVLSPDGSRVVFSLDVFPECEKMECTVERLEAEKRSGSTGRIYTELLFRHWDTWEDGRRSHLFTALLLSDEDSAEGGRGITIGPARDLMAGIDADSPTHPFGGTEEIAFSPDGREVAFAARMLPGSEAAWSTDVDLFRVPVNRFTQPVKITTRNRAWDTSPAYSPDGRWLAYLAMERPGFESDRLRIVVRRRWGGPPQVLTQAWDRSVSSLTWSPDSERLIVTAQDQGRQKIFSVDRSSGEVRTLVADHHNTSVAVSRHGRIYFLQDSSTSPAVLMAVDQNGGSEVRIASLNDALLEDLQMSPARDFSFKGAGGETVHGWLFQPVAGRRKGRRPVAFLIHGGPQGAWLDDFHYRWNPQIYAAAGYITLAINFHGSTGYGQAFTDSISGHWGDLPYEDLMKGLDHLLATEPAAAGKRVCALGASYGGYMINWFQGHTDRFSCMVNHDGIFDMVGSYFSTEELWFPEWEYRGTPWGAPDLYQRWSPSRFVDRWSTPILVIHSALDFRLPLSQGISTFTALRRRGIPAKFLYFPDENHWILKPANALLWHRTVLDWMAHWTMEGELR
ncbi:MAG: prolyl oligopeptidase family serine peptidase [Acidobacteriota bacterium]